MVFFLGDAQKKLKESIIKRLESKKKGLMRCNYLDRF
nr:hypothetical protein [Borreliella bavariensis]